MQYLNFDNTKARGSAEVWEIGHFGSRIGTRDYSRRNRITVIIRFKVFQGFNKTKTSKQVSGLVRVGNFGTIWRVNIVPLLTIVSRSFLGEKYLRVSKQDPKSLLSLLNLCDIE